jgi:death-on-curing protein
MPETSFDGEYLHPSVFEMAAAHLFHLARNHPFEDGNKRTALMCALVFRGSSGERLRADSDELYALVDGVAAEDVDKAKCSVFLMQRCADAWESLDSAGTCRALRSPLKPRA